jgi:predicted TIM-barrel fold metal-dependent hydrolase
VIDTEPFVDAHFHLWDLDHPTLRYDWLDAEAYDPFLGEGFHQLRTFNYGIANYLNEIQSSHVIKAVHVQAAIGTLDPTEETKWLQAFADRTGFPHAIVAYASLGDDDLASMLESHTSSPNVRGVRDLDASRKLTDETFRKGCSLLASHNLTLDIEVSWEQMTQTRDLAERIPGTRVVLDHAGLPAERSGEYFTNWRRGIRELAGADNVWCKISGLGMGDHDWTIETIRPYVETCIDAFGTDRTFFGTNWPVDRIYSSYGKLVNAYRSIVAGLRQEEQRALLSENAERFYRI